MSFINTNDLLKGFGIQPIDLTAFDNTDFFTPHHHLAPTTFPDPFGKLPSNFPAFPSHGVTNPLLDFQNPKIPSAQQNRQEGQRPNPLMGGNNNFSKPMERAYQDSYQKTEQYTTTTPLYGQNQKQPQPNNPMAYNSPDQEVNKIMFDLKRKNDINFSDPLIMKDLPTYNNPKPATTPKSSDYSPYINKNQPTTAAYTPTYTPVKNLVPSYIPKNNNAIPHPITATPNNNYLPMKPSGIGIPAYTPSNSAGQTNPTSAISKLPNTAGTGNAYPQTNFPKDQPNMKPALDAVMQYKPYQQINNPKSNVLAGGKEMRDVRPLNLPPRTEVPQSLQESTMLKSVSPFSKQAGSFQPLQAAKGNKQIREKFDAAQRTCEQTKSQFKDYEFPAVESSIAKPADLREYQQIKRWARPTEIWPNDEFELYFKVIEANDVQQGNLGDCAFLSAIASLAEQPQRVQKIFINKSKSQYGLYGVNIIWRGAVKEVLVDDYIPVDAKNKPHFQQSKEKELWAFLLEKAWAKLHGCYHQLNGMLAKEALHDLTGAAIRNFDPRKCDEQAVWKKLMNATRYRYIIVAGTNGEDTGDDHDPLKRVGLVSGHAYTIIGVFEVNINDKTGRQKQERLVKLRNPWGSFEWNKSYSDNDSNWDNLTQSSRQQVKHDNEEDGSFFMTWDSFRQYFDTLDICYYNNDFDYFGVRCRCPYNEGRFFEITVKEESECFFFLSQLSIRVFDENYQYEYPSDKGHYSEALMVITDKQGNTVFKINGKKRDLFSPKYIDNDNRPKLKAGVYYAYVAIAWQNQATHSFGFGVYAKNADIRQVTANDVGKLAADAQKWKPSAGQYIPEFEQVYGRV